MSYKAQVELVHRFSRLAFRRLRRPSRVFGCAAPAPKRSRHRKEPECAHELPSSNPMSRRISHAVHPLLGLCVYAPERSTGGESAPFATAISGHCLAVTPDWDRPLPSTRYPSCRDRLCAASTTGTASSNRRGSSTRYVGAARVLVTGPAARPASARPVRSFGANIGPLVRKTSKRCAIRTNSLDSVHRRVNDGPNCVP